MRDSLSTWWCRCGPGGNGPAPARSVRCRRSGVVQEAPLAGLAVGRVAELGQRHVGVAPVLVELVDLTGFLARGDLAAELAGDADQLTDGVRGGALLAELAPQRVLVAAARVQPQGHCHRVDRQD